MLRLLLLLWRSTLARLSGGGRRPGDDRDRDPAAVEYAEVVPDPVVLERGARTPILINLVTSGSAGERPRGVLEGPDGSRAELGFDRSDKAPYEEGWRAEHVFLPGIALGTWRAVIDYGAAVHELEFSVEDAEERDPATIVDFRVVPDPVEEDAPITLAGFLKAERSRLRDRRIALSFRPEDALAWSEIAEAWTGEDGDFAVTLDAWEPGWWRAVYYGTPRWSDGGRPLRSTRSEAVFMVMRSGPKTRSRFSGYTAQPSPTPAGKLVKHSGRLVHETPLDPPPGVEWVSAASREVTFWFKPAGGSWSPSPVGRATTTNNGSFTKKLPASRSGEWQVRYGGQSGDLKATPKSCQVKVR
ncbi:hypothetical protein [Microtetraspora sp. NBRC 16547]|uniref:hypothetical protein n=1 Tax=Microtetraspora sp. NBRC 16547 TaxID=3030993 RepID=UPI0024A5D704|nr:hypothetical protein [Microtetraspora sp. NBRC 16547]GLX01649.1 hypothetical protein Misp02_57350 [Microtetraspora sp. NBRC 16547]